MSRNGPVIIGIQSVRILALKRLLAYFGSFLDKWKQCKNVEKVLNLKLVKRLISFPEITSITMKINSLMNE